MDKEALQILNMFMIATQNAKLKNKYEFHYNVQRETLIELFKKAFPLMQDEAKLLNLVDITMKG